MKCLGIESTAHTFSVGIINDKGEILGLAGRTYTPDAGGLHPQKVVEHHYTCFDQVLLEALGQANLNLSEIDLIAFSQGPGLGPCLRVGAATARTLALSLNKPIVGVNHCIAHVEIGRLMCGTKDPITLYVSGGNTIISAFDSNRYQIFGETLDLPVGNMLDMIARLLGIPHPGGPKLEAMAKEGKKYLTLPYVVKGMDLSFSGLFTAARQLIESNSYLQQEFTQSDVVYSIQETSFAMLAEVFERAIAHTEKKEVLLTGGVAANHRLQEMIAYISAEHNAVFHVVPRNVAGDNGAMIAWAGLIQFMAGGGMSIKETRIQPKWRMDDVSIPWRDPKFDDRVLAGSSSPLSLSSKDRSLDSLNSEITQKPLSDEEILHAIAYPGVILRKGAEAALISGTWHNRDVIIKFRVPKKYRNEEIDANLRGKRTSYEAKILIELNSQGIPVPAVYEADPDMAFFVMKQIPGRRLKDVLIELSNAELSQVFDRVGQIIAQIHLGGYIHGDLTTSNIIFTPQGHLFFIDFGLAQASKSIEDRAVDLHLFKRVLTSTHASFFEIVYPAFLQGYTHGFSPKEADAQEIIQKIDEIEVRGRYIGKENRKGKKNIEIEDED